MGEWNRDAAFNAAAAAERAQYEKAQAAQTQPQCAEETRSYIGQAQAVGRARLSLREEAEKQVGEHRAQADRADRAAAFFREHPEFDEFIQLIRAGVIGV